MSGGHFDYKQYVLEDIADEINSVISENEENYNFSKETISKFTETEKTVRAAAKMLHRVDWLICGDDGEDSFHANWKEDMDRLNK